jgi:hypothetical protein
MPHTHTYTTPSYCQKASVSRALAGVLVAAGSGGAAGSACIGMRQKSAGESWVSVRASRTSSRA